MDQARLEQLLDGGWELIELAHQWLSRWPHDAEDQSVVDNLIRRLQSIWAIADDLEAKRLCRAILALEQMLERYCAGSVRLSNRHLDDFVRGFACLQDLLLGFEATREEPLLSNVDDLLRLERHSAQAVDLLQDDRADPQVSEAVQPLPVITESNGGTNVDAELVSHDVVSVDEAEASAMLQTVERTLFRMLNQFAHKLDDACQQLHARMLDDNTPYVTTTSRLEHLSQASRELVDQILSQPRSSTFATDESFQLQTESSIIEEIKPPIAEELQDAAAEVDLLPVPSPFEIELDKLDHEVANIHPRLWDQTEAEENDQPSFVEVAAPQGRILIIEESLFYRHLISSAVQSAGYGVVTLGSVEDSLSELKRSPDFIAILVATCETEHLVDAIHDYRISRGAKVIAVVGANETAAADFEFDDCVSKTSRTKLLAKLDQILRQPIRQSA